MSRIKGSKVQCTVDPKIKGRVVSYEGNIACVKQKDGSLAHIPFADLKNIRRI